MAMPVATSTVGTAAQGGDKGPGGRVGMQGWSHSPSQPAPRAPQLMDAAAALYIYPTMALCSVSSSWERCKHCKTNVGSPGRAWSDWVSALGAIPGTAEQGASIPRSPGVTGAAVAATRVTPSSLQVTQAVCCKGNSPLPAGCSSLKIILCPLWV